MASFIPKSFINDLLSRCDIIGLIDQFVSLRKQGSNYVARCPFHEESTPSFSVSESKQIYHCFGCGAGGNAISFIMNHEKRGFIEAIEWLANHLQIPMPKGKSQAVPSNRISALYTALDDSVKFYQTQLQHHPGALGYLERRGINTKSIQQFNIGFAPSSWDALSNFLRHTKKHRLENLQMAGLVVKNTSSRIYDRFRSRIIFPIRDKQGRFIGLGGRALDKENEPKYLNSPETPIFYKSRELYGLHESYTTKQKAERIWVVEGYIDVITLYQFNITPVVATLGTTTSFAHLQQLFRFTSEIIFCFDGDAAGQKAAVRAVELSLKHIQDDWSIRFLLLPKSEDPDSWIRKLNSTDTTTLLQPTLSIENFLFQYMQRGIDIETVDGQRQLLQKMFPLLKKMPATIRRLQLFQRLARLINIEVDKLENLGTQSNVREERVLQRPKTRTVLDRAISLLLQYPKLLSSHLPHVVNERFQATHPLLCKLIQCIQKTNDPYSAMLLEQFRDTPEHIAYFTALANYNWLVPEEGVVAEFKDTLIHLNKSLQYQAIQRFLHKARTSGLSLAERNQLNQLLNERQSG